MKTIHTTNYKLYNNKTNSEFKICLMSDLHYCHEIKDEKLNMILKKIEKIEPNYTMIPGDLVEGKEEIKNIQDRKRILIWLKEISNISKTLISLGNHDYFNTNLNLKNISTYLKYQLLRDFFNEIAEYSNLYVLNNENFSDDKIFVTGYSQSKYYFKNDNIENKDFKYDELNKLIKNNTIPNDKINFLMAHSPMYLDDKEFLDLLENYDYFLSGHMHNGVVPPILYEIWNSSKGIIAPNRTLFPKNSRNTLKAKDDKLVVTGALSTIHEYLKPYNMFNFIYPSYMTILDFTKDKKFDTKKVYTKRYYR